MDIIDVTKKEQWERFKLEMARLEQECFEDDSYFPDELFENLEKSIYITVGLTEENKIVSYAAVETDPDGHVYIWSLAVDVEHRGQKIGEKMINDILNHFPDTPVRLMVRQNNFPAIKIYERCGFVPYGIQISAYVHGESGILMESSNT